MITRTEPCCHKNGWYATVRFWIFRKRVFVCSDGGACLEVAK